ncbi:shematrin-like protein 3 [Lingula anatina]|uniref:Shematrin-like protein 3 n=1 Tax=Lingula anatina TaxID=7574 RepID=A0A1S3HBZ2_LINAN|nr:shematrin-like protein 3 [Lingula anatina]|eukprot:XP_013383533.1 shematrin-like protein 3 [Lingula anatina]
MQLTLSTLVLIGLAALVRGAEIDLLGVCDPHKDICVAKYSSCEPFLGNVNGEKYAMVEAKAGLLEVNPNSRRCTCLPGFSAVNIGKAVGDSVRLECVPVEGASCYTDGDCNIRNLDCLPLLSLLPGIFGATGQLNSDSLFAPGFLTPATQAIYSFIAGFLQLSTQFLCGFNRVNTIEYKCDYPSPSKSDTYMYGGGAASGHGTGFAGVCKRVNRNGGYQAASSLTKGSQTHQQPAAPSFGHGGHSFGHGAFSPYGGASSMYGAHPFGGMSNTFGAGYGGNTHGRYGGNSHNTYGGKTYGAAQSGHGMPRNYGGYGRK